jgi:hypothetical protein
MELVTQVFAIGEDTHALRLPSELAVLRAGYVNWGAARFALARALQVGVTPPKNEKKHPET